MKYWQKINIKLSLKLYFLSILIYRKRFWNILRDLFPIIYFRATYFEPKNRKKD